LPASQRAACAGVAITHHKITLASREISGRYPGCAGRR
jgi:hypothetical protein